VRVVAQEVEQFWLHDMVAQDDPMHAALQYLHAQRKGASDVGMSALSKRPVRGRRLFTYGSRGMSVWFRLTSLPLAASGVPPSFRCNSLLDFDAEVYPLGLDSAIGVIVGITKGLRTRSATSGVMMTPRRSSDRRMSQGNDSAAFKDGPSPFWGPVVCFRLQTQLQPYLHGVLMHLVTNEHAAPGTATTPTAQCSDAADMAVAQPSAAARAQLEYAYHIANACRTHEYFSVALELLLHTALTPPSSASFLRAHGSSSLASVVAFLSRFREFPDVVMHVARKNDAASWPRLFREAGSPQDLFALCMEQGKLRMASCYLVVIQRTAGMVAAREAATQIVERIAQDEDGGGNYHAVRRSTPSLTTTHSLSIPPSSSASSSHAPFPAPSLSASPSVTFHRRRRLTALESELHRFIALTREMEAEQIQMQRQQRLAAEQEALRQQQLVQQQLQQQYPAVSGIHGTLRAAADAAVAPGTGSEFLPSPELLSRVSAAAAAAAAPGGVHTPGVTPSVTGGAPVVLFSPQPGLTPLVSMATPGTHAPQEQRDEARRQPALPAVDEEQEGGCIVS
jgi:type II secretory pathway pseudopilin PulG